MKGKNTVNWWKSASHLKMQTYIFIYMRIASSSMFILWYFLVAKNGSSGASEPLFFCEATLSFHKAKTEGNICQALSFGPTDSKYSSKSCALPWACCHMPLENVTTKSHNTSPASDPHLIFLFFKYWTPHLILWRYMLPSSEYKTIVIIGLYI